MSRRANKRSNKAKADVPVDDASPRQPTEAELMKAQYAGIDSDEEEEFDLNNVDIDGIMKKRGKAEKGKIRWLHVGMLLMLMGTAILPAVMFIFDTAGSTVSGLLPSLGATLASMGLAKTPKRRLTQFYEKHNPEKVDDVPVVLTKYAGNYKVMVKKLEAKYNDYGFFIGWEEDGGFAEMQKKALSEISVKGAALYQQYVPWQIRQGFKNIYLNLNFYGKKAYKLLDKMVGGKPSSTKKKSSGSSKKRRSSSFRDD